MSRESLIVAGRRGPLPVSGSLAGLLAEHGGPCPELLNLEKPRAVRAAHRRYLDAGARVIRTNTAGASPERLDRYRMHDEAFIVSYMAAEHAVQTAREVAAETGIERWVLGVARIESRLRPLGFLSLDRVESAARTMASGLAGGGADAIVIEASQDTVRLVAALNGVRQGMTDAGRSLPVMVTLRYDPTMAPPHRDRVTADLAQAAAAAAGLGVAALGIANADLAESWPDTLRAAAKAFPGPLLAETAPASTELAAVLGDPVLGPRVALAGGGASPADTALLCETLLPLRRLEGGSGLPPAANDSDAKHTVAEPLRRPKGA